MEAAGISILGILALVAVANLGFVLRLNERVGRLGERVARLEGTIETLKDILTRREQA